MTKKYYLSRAQTRAMSGYEPIGDAFGGAAYGEKNDPVSAGFAIYSMYGAYAATAMTVWQGIAAVGGAMTLLGQVTGNSKLTKLGGLAMLGGNIGQFASTAMADPTSLTPETTGTNAAPTTGAEGNLAPVVDAGGPVEVLNAPPPSAPVDAGPITDTTIRGINTPNVDGVTNVNMPINNQLTPPPVEPGGVEVVDRVGAAVQPPAPTGPYDPTTATRAVDYAPGGKFGPPAGTGTGSTFMSDLAKNPMGMYAAASVVGQVGDYLSGKTDAEIDAMKAQTGYNNAKALETQALLDKEKLRRANLNSGYTSVDTSMKVNPNAQITRPWQQQAATPVNPAGLIAGARKA